MHPIEFTPTHYAINGQPVYLNSGEFHYFRVPKSDWRRRMALFKAAGGNCLATYIPWLIHEPEEGTFAFGDVDWRDLEGFLQTAADAGLYVVARPGPYQYSELLYGGLPGWLIQNYPQLLARTLAGEPFGMPSVSYLHPLFLEKVRAWFAAVCPILARYTVAQGGPIALTQFDNELTGIHIWFGGLDYNAEALGFGQADGRYPRFLRARYGDIARLNAAYDAAYGDFVEVMPAPRAEDTPADVRRARDTFDFYTHATAEYAQTLCRMLREFGIDTPFIHNAANPEMNPYFLETIAALDEPFVLGSDHYYNLDQHWPQNNPTPQYARRVFLSCEELRLFGFPPTVLELPGGSASDWPPITPEDALACYLTNLAYGMKGHNVYIFTGGPNPPGVGESTDMYDYGAAIGADGDVRPLYAAQKALGDVIAQYPWLVEAERAGDCRLALDFEYARAERYYRPNYQTWELMERGPLTTAFCAGASPVCVNLDSDDWVTDVATPLIVVSAESMGRAKQERLMRFLQNGGKMLIMPTLPTLDETLEPCTVLADCLGATPVWLNVGRVVRAAVGGVVNVRHGAAYVSDTLPLETDVIGVNEYSGDVLAWHTTTDGGGQAIMLGLAWVHSKHEHTAMLRALLTRLGWEPRVVCSNPNIWTSLRVAGERGLLFILNLYSSPMEAEVSYRDATGALISTGTHRLGAMTVKVVEVHL
ncbi:MAG TPA: beta-galactosidase [Anaerolineae bacterium]|nr:beta-galactosidase [Anaerolineae bacterium]